VRARRPVQYAPLTSLLDVMFILVFASLIHSAALEKKHSEAAIIAKPVPVPVTKPAVPAAPPAQVDPAVQAARDAEALRRAAVAQLVTGLEGRSPVVARIGRDGVLRALDRMSDGRVVTAPLGIPLVERVPDPDVGLVYLGERPDGPHLCTLLRLHLGARNLSDTMIIVAPDVPLARLSVALARGLQRDAERCLADQRGIAVIVDPRAAPAAPKQGGTP
jgi:hypothetical protein